VTRSTHDSNVGAAVRLRIEHVERVCAFVDAANVLLACPYPTASGATRVTEMRNVFMRALRMGLTDTSYLNVCHHNYPFVLDFTKNVI
jgi:hypothetical protein